MKKILVLLSLLMVCAPISATNLIDEVAKGTANYSASIKILDSATGVPSTDIVFNSAGIDLWCHRPGSAHTSIVEVTQTEAGAHTDGGFVHVSDGKYRLDLPDSCLATGVDYVDLGGAVTGEIIIAGRIKLTGLDMNDAVRGGMSALPNAAADAAGGLPISDAGGLALDDLPTTAEFNARTILSADYFDWTTDAVANVTLVGTTTTNTDMRGTDSALLAANVPTNFSDLSILATTGRVDVGEWLGTAVAALQDADDFSANLLGTSCAAPAAGTIEEQMCTDVDAILVDTVAGGTGPWTTGAGGGDGSSLTSIPWNAAWDAEVQSEVTDSSITLGLDHLMTAAVTGTDVVDNSILAYFASEGVTADWDTYNNITDSFEARRNLLGSIGVTIGTAGAGLTALPWNAAWDTEVESEVSDGLLAIHLDHLLAADYDPAIPPGVSTALWNELIESNLGVSRFTIGALEQAPSGSGASVSAIADGVWTEALGDHSASSGSTAEALANASASGDPWATALPGAYTAGQAGFILGNGVTLADNSINAAALAVDAIDEIWNEVIEPNGSITARCLLAMANATLNGEFTQSSGAVTARDQTGTSVRVTATVTATGRNAITFTCP